MSVKSDASCAEQTLLVRLDSGDPVAILPAKDSPARDVLEVARIKRIGEVYLELEDGRIFATLGGKSLVAKRLTYAVPATDEHRSALRRHYAAVLA
jgi:hypothetical protein